MVSSPIGGFMPIPLAMMPAFMAYQSILMGDSFGQAYQYGKRRISAMSNEEFNKQSISKIFSDSLIEYDRMIPSLKQSMQNSQELQGFIVKELLAIIPNLIADAFGGTDERDITQSPFLKNQSQATQQTAPTQIRYTTDRDPVLNKPAIDKLTKSIDPLLEQRGTKQQLASEKEAIRQYNLDQLNSRKPAYVEPVFKTTTTKQQDEFNNWTRNLTHHQTAYRQAVNQLNDKSTNTKYKAEALANKKRYAGYIKFVSNDYRNPNPLIQKAVIRLRQEMANGNWK